MRNLYQGCSKPFGNKCIFSAVLKSVIADKYVATEETDQKKKKKKARERKKIFFFHEQRNLGSLISYTLLSCSPVTPVPPFPPDARHSFGVLCHFSSLFPSSTHWAEVGELNSPIFLSQRKLRWLSPPSSIQVPVFMLFADNRYI